MKKIEFHAINEIEDNELLNNFEKYKLIIFFNLLLSYSSQRKYSELRDF